MDIVSWIQKIDNEIILFLNGLHSPWLDSFMIFLSAKYALVPLYLSIIILFVKKYKKQGWLYLMLLLVCVIISDRVSSGLAKPYFERLRPCYNLNIQLHQVIPCGGKYGFFSSHASNAFVVTVFSSLILNNRNFSYLLFIVALLVSITRI